jgi:hypothetical protein
VSTAREPLLKGKAKDSSIKFRLVAFEDINIIYIFTKQAYLVRKSTHMILPLQLVFLATAKACIINIL